MKISNRLKTIADLVTFDTFADIGTDHGYVPIYLANCGKVTKAIACDLRKDPLQKAVENIRDNKVSHIVETRLGSGFSKVEPNEVQTGLIAGMGGMLITNIIRDDIETVKSLKELILSPHEDVGEVRKFMHEIGFSILDEIMLRDGKRIYTALKCEPNISEKYDTDVEYEYGKILLERREPLLLELLERQEKQCVKAMGEVEKAYQNKEMSENILIDLKYKMKLIEEAKKYFL